jgi:hypothetical protein
MTSRHHSARRPRLPQALPRNSVFPNEPETPFVCNTAHTPDHAIHRQILLDSGCSLFSISAVGPKKLTPPSKQSACITSIQAAGGTYYFSYGGGTVPHLTAVSGVEVSDTFGFQTWNLTDPFAGASFGTTQVLANMNSHISSRALPPCGERQHCVANTSVRPDSTHGFESIRTKPDSMCPAGATGMPQLRSAFIPRCGPSEAAAVGIPAAKIEFLV